MKISVDIQVNMLYYNQEVARKRLKHKKCRSGGIGRRAGFRCLWSQDRVGSSPISCIVFFALRIKNWSGGPIRIALMGSVKTFRQGIFIFPEKKIIPTGHFMPNTHFKSIPEKKFP